MKKTSLPPQTERSALSALAFVSQSESVGRMSILRGGLHRKLFPRRSKTGMFLYEPTGMYSRRFWKELTAGVDAADLHTSSAKDETS